MQTIYIFALRIFPVLIVLLSNEIYPQQPVLSSLPDPRMDFLYRQVVLSNETDHYFTASLRFQQPPSSDLLKQIETLGVGFLKKDGQFLGSRTIYPVELNWEQVSALSQQPEIVSIQPSWRPMRRPPLDVSRPQVQADSVWSRVDPNGSPITGKGVLIADFDTGVDFFHPMLFFADGDTLNWIDVNGNNLFDPGIDAVDINKNSAADAGEILRYRELSYSGSGNTSGVYDTHLDFLYNDANNNGQRDYGVSSGFTEQSPTYGEQWFITLDVTHDKRLSVGEKLVGLKTSKIRAIRETDGTVRRRGVDLIYANPDNGPYGGHGTSVAGIAIGGIAGVHKAAGIAPGAEMIFASIDYNNSPRFFTSLPAMIAWAQSEGAKVMLYEDGEWAWEYLDGSSNEEIMINEMAQAGIVQVVPAGNLTGGYMQKTIVLNPGDSVAATFNGNSASTIWPSLRWAGDTQDVRIYLRVGASAVTWLPCNGSTISIGGKNVYSNIGVSSRGTAMAILHIASASATTYTFYLVNRSATQKRVEGMLADNGFSWSGLARWVSPSETNTMTWPSTADSAIGVGAYKNKMSDTDINSFSGRGVRMDNTSTLVVAAPGSTVYSIARNVSYTAFGGTSAAGPHVAGAAALLLQADPSLGHAGVKALLKKGALADGFTGQVPNTTWGYGKLRILNSLLTLISVHPVATSQPQFFVLHPNFPNPFNPSTTIRYELPAGSPVRLSIYNVLGQEIRTLVNSPHNAGLYTVVWDGRNHSGERVPSGLYLYRLVTSQNTMTRKMLLIK